MHGMPTSGPLRSRVSRETRLLLLTVLLSVVALLVLARLRFPERPGTPTLVPPLLAQLAPHSPFQELSSAIAAVEAELAPNLIILKTKSLQSAAAARPIPALRFRDDVAFAVLPDAETTVESVTILARDRANGLVLVRVSAAAPSYRRWTPERGETVRFLLVTEPSATGVSLWPAFVGPVQPAISFRWEAAVWQIPEHTTLLPGAFVFTATGALAGAVVNEAGGQAVVPIDTLVQSAERLLAAGQTQPGWIGISVQDLTPVVAQASGAPSGAVVVAVDPHGPAAVHLEPTDVIEAINGQTILGKAHGEARLARVALDEQLVIRVRRGGRSQDVTVKAVAPPSPSVSQVLGLGLRSRQGMGAEVTRVDADSIASRAGVVPGDVITRAGEINEPAAAELLTAFASMSSGETLLLAITRGPERMVIGLRKP